jgi:hypothetical protein
MLPGQPAFQLEGGIATISDLTRAWVGHNGTTRRPAGVRSSGGHMRTEGLKVRCSTGLS